VKRHSFAAFPIAALVGVFYGWVALQFWASYSLNSPLLEWLRTTLPGREHHLLRVSLIYAHDVLLNLLLAVPFAAVFQVFSPLRRWRYVGVAVACALSMTFWGADWADVKALVTLAGFWIPIAMTRLSLPLALLSVRAAASRWNGG
jgi:hypothetical protein